MSPSPRHGTLPRRSHYYIDICSLPAILPRIRVVIIVFRYGHTGLISVGTIFIFHTRHVLHTGIVNKSIIYRYSF